MENNDLAFIIPHLGQEALYRVLSSLALQSDKRFAVYGFCLRSEPAIKALFEDYAEQMDLLVCEVDAYPEKLAPIIEHVAFFLRPLGRERFVTFSDGETLYDRDCVREFHRKVPKSPAADLFRWQKKGRSLSFGGYFRRFVLDEGDIPLSQLVVRRSPLEQGISQTDYFSRRQLLAELAMNGGMVALPAGVTHPETDRVIDTDAQVRDAEDRCSVIEWAEARFEREWPVGRWKSLYATADLFTNLVPWVSKEQMRERFMALKMAKESPGLAQTAYFFNSWGL